MFEVCCWIFSAMCMAVILGVLVHWDGKGVPNWKGMTLNSFISVLSGFCRAALLVPTAEALGQLKWNWFSRKPRKMMDFELLDSASRGPWGSFVLLARTKGITLHSVGAAIILLALPLDLFFQQIVAYPTVWVKTPYNSTLARSTVYQPPATVATWQGGKQIFGDQILYSVYQSYFLRDPVATTYNPGCPTSNCTFEPFDTLAVCSSCVDAKPNLQFGCQTATGDWLPDVAPADVSPNVTSCGWFFNTPGAIPQLMTGYWINQSQPQDALATRILPLTDVLSNSPLVPGGSINFKSIQNPITDFLLASTPSGIAGAYKNETPVVSECVLSWCVQTIEASFSFGNYSENITKEVQLNTNDADNAWSTHPNFYRPQYSLTLDDNHGSTGKTEYGLNNMTALMSHLAVMEWFPSCWYARDQDSLSFKSQWDHDPPLVYPGSANPWGVTKNVSEVLSSLAKSLTNTIRITKNDDTQELSLVNGTSWKQETHVRLRWAWFSVPFFLLLFSLIFLVSVVTDTRRHDAKVGVWKTSALATLFNGLGDEIQDTIGPKVRIGDARTRAKNMEVHLDD